jgi:hypothetical protein
MVVLVEGFILLLLFFIELLKLVDLNCISDLFRYECCVN